MKRNKKSGFTIMEIVVVIAIVGILAGTLAPLIGATIDAWSRFSENRDIISGARSAMFRITREIRQIKDSSSLTSIGASSISFTDIYNNSISFSQSGTDLMRNSYVLASNLASSGGLSFVYKDGNGNITANIIDIRRIEVSIEIDGKTGSITLQNKIWPRNLN